MKIAVAVQGVQDTPALQKKADFEIVRHADAAVHLDGFGGRQVGRTAHFRLGQAGDFRAVCGVLVQRLQCLENE